VIPIPSDKRRFRRIAAFMLLAAAAVALYFSQRNPPIRMVGLAAIAAAVALVRSSRGDLSIQEMQNRPPPLSLIHWIIGVILAVLTLVAAWLLHWAAATNDPSATWTVYAFAGTSLVAGIYWAAILTRLQESGT
jgi:hypothetical protein